MNTPTSRFIEMKQQAKDQLNQQKIDWSGPLEDRFERLMPGLLRDFSKGLQEADDSTLFHCLVRLESLFLTWVNAGLDLPFQSFEELEDNMEPDE